MVTKLDLVVQRIDDVKSHVVDVHKDVREIRDNIKQINGAVKNNTTRVIKIEQKSKLPLGGSGLIGTILRILIKKW